MCLIEGTGGVRYEDDIVLLSAGDWAEARKKAIALGRTREKEYLNTEGRRVRWAFERLITLDELGEIVDGIEVYSQPVEIGDQPTPFDHDFNPESFEPTQSV